ncbi:MAG: hypothetical protein HW380_3239 [Magnetococcales bacterium]|nr:hypothetical protein [Magnetococcales bacterium]
MKRIGFFLGCLFFVCLLVRIPAAWAEKPLTPDSKDNEGTTQEALDEARGLFLGAMDALNRAGKMAYEKNVPGVREKAKDVLEESKKMLQQWMDRVQKEMDGQEKKQKQGPDEPRRAERSYI